ncbi:hypothetical protein HAZT_HAZT007005 [Hyalella azteca]|uniref:DNA methyltransferase 1-associated protein 1 n=1 Tax=Hyalella azteca TaxID=294128 RepID=A0A6A0H8Z0_HYAAZ|nr:hypothetical protein HAZT_HAZT007005 [Hyalella azteca]
MSDVHDILELERPNSPEISKAAILGLRSNAVPVKKKEKDVMRRPEGMHRELFALLYSSDGNKELPPLLQTDSMPQQGYKRTKARLGMRRVRPWAWVQFCNPARKDGALLYHWRRVADQGKEYPFAQFNKHVDVLQYTDSEYRDHLVSDTWSRSDSDKLMELCQQFDLRWPVIHDRWPRNSTEDSWTDQQSDSMARSMEDIKERYYFITNTLKKIEEEQQLLSEMRRIDARKKERERKTQDLQKLIAGGGGESAAGGDSTPSARRQSKQYKKRMSTGGVGVGLNKLGKQDSLTNSSSGSGTSALHGASGTTDGIRFPELRSSGVALRSHTLKLPASLGLKKLKAIEHLLTELNIAQKMCTEALNCNLDWLQWF